MSNDSKWSTTTIGKSSYLRGRIGWQGLRASEFKEDGPFLVTGTDFKGGQINWDTCYHVSEERYAEAEYIHVQDNDVLITKDGTIGKIALVRDCPEKTVLNSGIFLLRCKDSSYQHPFIYHVLQSFVFQKFLDDNLAGSTIQHLYQYVFEKFKFETPPLPEQSKIAEILSTVDKAIEQTENLIAKQQRIKTGLMQDLLTRGIDEHGNLRSEETHEFKDSSLGRIPVEWEVKQLDECVDFLDGKRVPLKQADRDKMKGEIPYYGASGIIDYIDRYLFDEELILVGEDGENVVSRNLPLAFKVSGKLWVNNHAHVLKPKQGFNIDFLTERLEFYDYTLLVSGSAQPKLNQYNLRQMKLPIPTSNEQEQIGKIMGVYGKRYAEITDHQTKLRSLKTALMQDLLTGKVRVTPLLENMETKT
jgi:type I restriction enzyme S subunit